MLKSFHLKQSNKNKKKFQKQSITYQNVFLQIKESAFKNQNHPLLDLTLLNLCH